MSLESRIDKAETKARQRTPRGLQPLVEHPVGIVYFVTTMLGKGLFPRQGSLLKLMALAADEFTEYDLSVYDHWMSRFERVVDEDGDLVWEGQWGMPGDVLWRVDRCIERGAAWFNEILLILGRRSGKGYLTSALFSWRVWKLLEMGDPHTEYNIDRNKAMVLFVFSVKYDQAKRDLFRDVVTMITDAPCFAPFLGTATSDCVTILTPRQLAEGAQAGHDRGLIEIRAGETTMTAPRGTATFAVGFDEFSHVKGAGSTADSEEIYTAAVPGTAQFGSDKLIVQASSPWEQTGQLYKSRTQALQCDPDTAKALSPTTLAVQLSSWDPYLDFEIAHEIAMWPGGPCYPAQSRAIIAVDDPDLAARRTHDPQGYASEYQGEFRTALNAYIPAESVSTIFGEWRGQRLTMQTQGVLATTYVAHGDPARSGANFAFGIGHIEIVDGVAHTVFDYLKYWRPQDFTGGKINYIDVDAEIFAICHSFALQTVTFDQYNSAGSIDRLQAALDAARLPWRTAVMERTATANFNWRAAETFKIAAMAGLVHAPRFPQAQTELEYLQVNGDKVTAPATGPVTTKDVADVMININYTLREDMAPSVIDRLRQASISGAQPGGFPTSIDPVHQALSDFGKGSRGPTDSNPPRRPAQRYYRRSH